MLDQRSFKDGSNCWLFMPDGLSHEAGGLKRYGTKFVSELGTVVVGPSLTEQEFRESLEDKLRQFLSDASTSTPDPQL